jgi:hypothetical protein
MFHQGAKIPGSHPLLQGDAETGRTLKIGTIEEAEQNGEAIQKIILAWCELQDQK